MNAPRGTFIIKRRLFIVAFFALKFKLPDFLILTNVWRAFRAFDINRNELAL